MAVSFYQLVINAHDLPALARFWCQVLDWQVLFEDEDEIVIGADANALPGICFVPVGERKTVKNRLHIDLTPDDRAAEVERILALGASRADVGQGEDVTLGRPRRSRGQRVLRAAPEEVATGVIRVLRPTGVRQVPRGFGSTGSTGRPRAGRAHQYVRQPLPADALVDVQQVLTSGMNTMKNSWAKTPAIAESTRAGPRSGSDWT